MHKQPPTIWHTAVSPLGSLEADADDATPEAQLLPQDSNTEWNYVFIQDCPGEAGAAGAVANGGPAANGGPVASSLEEEACGGLLQTRGSRELALQRARELNLLHSVGSTEMLTGGRRMDRGNTAEDLAQARRLGLMHSMAPLADPPPDELPFPAPVELLHDALIELPDDNPLSPSLSNPLRSLLPSSEETPTEAAVTQTTAVLDGFSTEVLGREVAAPQEPTELTTPSSGAWSRFSFMPKQREGSSSRARSCVRKKEPERARIRSQSWTRFRRSDSNSIFCTQTPQPLYPESPPVRRDILEAFVTGGSTVGASRTSPPPLQVHRRQSNFWGTLMKQEPSPVGIKAAEPLATGGSDDLNFTEIVPLFFTTRQ